MKERISRALATSSNRAAVAAGFSLSLNGLIGVGKLVLGLCISSVWFVVNAIYYLVLCAARFYVLRQYSETRRLCDPSQRLAREYAVFRHGGVFLCLIGGSYLIVCLRMYSAGDSAVYGGYIVYLVAAVSFTKMGLAVHGAVANRHLQNPIASTLKRISFSDAIVSIVITQCTLLTFCGSPQAITSSALLGMGASACIMAIGLFMLLRKKAPHPPFQERSGSC